MVHSLPSFWIDSNVFTNKNIDTYTALPQTQHRVLLPLSFYLHVTHYFIHTFKKKSPKTSLIYQKHEQANKVYIFTKLALQGADFKKYLG